MIVGRTIDIFYLSHRRYQNRQYMMEKKDWLLLVLAAAKKNGLTPVQLQKSLFLIGAEIPESIRNGFYNFVQCDYGPSDKAIYADAQTLEAAALIRTAHKSTRR